MSTPTVTVEPELPSQQPRSLEEKALQIRQQQALIAELRAQSAAVSEPQLAAQADRLEQQYHAREMAGLADDVYRSAAHEPPLQAGWLRASEHPELLRQAGVDWSDEQIRQYLQPNDSNFRAEIYLPDPAVFGPDAKPVVCYKGSMGPVAAQDEQGATVIRDSAAEDWLHNARQGSGLESDYYDRAMRLAVDLNRSALGGRFEIAGHSLGGGLASAASAVIGIPATTINAAGLHANTAQRFAERNGLSVFDTAQTVTAIQVQGEILTDVQVGVGQLGDLRRMQLGAVANMAADVSRLPGARERMEGLIEQSFPHSTRAQHDALGLLDYLAENSGSRILQNVPTAAGQVQPALPAKMRDADGNLVDRPAEMALTEVARDGGPLLNVLTGALVGAQAGKQAGQAIAAGGQLGETVLDKIGDGYQLSGRVTGQAAEFGAQTVGQIAGWQVRQGGEAVAQVRLGTGYLGAAMPMAQCVDAQWRNATTNGLLKAVNQLPFADRVFPGIQERIDRNERATEAYCDDRREQATQSIQGARQDADGIRRFAEQGSQAIQQSANTAGAGLRQAGEQAGLRVDLAFDEAGRIIRNTTDRAPTALAAGGAILGTAGAVHATYFNNLPVGLNNAFKTYTVVNQGGASASEATLRHGMTSAAIPSLDARTMELEHQAVERLTRSRSEQQRLQHAPDETPAQRLPAGAGGRASVRPIESGLLLNQPGHPDYRLFQDAASGIHALDARANRVPDLRSDQLSGHLAVAAKQEGMTGIDHVVMSQDASRTFAVQGRLEDPAHQRASVDTVQGLNTPLAQSTLRMAEVDGKQAEQAHSHALAQQQEQETASRGAMRFA
ncbi:XVIPCD domain-containing protein [Pseudoxanthomonas wuyuanensis]